MMGMGGMLHFSTLVVIWRRLGRPSSYLCFLISSACLPASEIYAGHENMQQLYRIFCSTNGLTLNILIVTFV